MHPPAPPDTIPPPHRIALPDRLDLAAAEDIIPRIAASRGHRLELDGIAVRSVGTLFVQLLLSTRQQWQSDGQHMIVVSPSPALCEGLDRLGLTAHLMSDDTGAVTDTKGATQ